MSRVIYLKPYVSDPHTGQDVRLRGYAAVWSVVSAGIRDGFPEILAPGSFDKFLAMKCAPPDLIFNHQGKPGLMTSVVRVWTDSIGLAFEASQIKFSPENDRIVRMIANGSLSGVSYTAYIAEGGSNIEEVSDGRKMRVIRDMAWVEEFGPQPAPMYPETGIWLSSADPRFLQRSHLHRLACQWQKSAPATMTVSP